MPDDSGCEIEEHSGYTAVLFGASLSFSFSAEFAEFTEFTPFSPYFSMSRPSLARSVAAIA
jgi:hypothetical protein